MHHLETDEKLCPFCAEVIKAAAVKCRYCHSDLTPPDPLEEETPAPEAPASVTIPSPVAEPVAAPSFHDARSAPRGALATWWPTVILVLVIALAAFVGVRLWQLGNADSAQLDRLVAPASDGSDRSARSAMEVAQGVVTSDTAKTAGLVAATNAVQTVLSYSAATLDKDKAAAHALLTGKVRDQYDATMASITPSTLKNEVKVEATVVAASIITADDHHAVALLFVNQTTTSRALKVPRVDQNRVVVTLTRNEGDWSVTDLNAL